jgi:hypothetical protein
VKSNERWPSICGDNWVYEDFILDDYIIIIPPRDGNSNLIVISYVKINDKKSSYQEEYYINQGRWVVVSSKNGIDI